MDNIEQIKLYKDELSERVSIVEVYVQCTFITGIIAAAITMIGYTGVLAILLSIHQIVLEINFQAAAAGVLIAAIVGYLSCIIAEKKTYPGLFMYKKFLTDGIHLCDSIIFADQIMSNMSYAKLCKLVIWYNLRPRPGQSIRTILMQYCQSQYDLLQSRKNILLQDLQFEV